MKKVNHTITIHASADKVWAVLWGEHSYKQWTKVFHECSYAESDWQKGSEIRFLTPEGSGMYSRIEELIVKEKMTFQHLGEIREFINLPAEGNDKEWMNALESYTLVSRGESTDLTVELETLDHFETFFNVSFPKGLEIVKLLSEITEHRIIVQEYIKSPIDTIWNKWTQPDHVCNWNFAHPSWCNPSAENDLREGGSFNYRMEARDRSFGFNLKGTYTKIDKEHLLEYHLEDNRKVSVLFSHVGEAVVVTQCFEPEGQNPEDMQQQGWQAILTNFKAYCEN